MITGQASGKLILFGEHAVVHGHPAIAVPFNGVQATVTATPSEGGLVINLPQTDDTAHYALHRTAQLVLDHLGIETPDLTLTLASTIPIAAGFGSGAAISTALARALYQALQQPLDKKTLNQIIHEVEKIHHNTPSGIDNTVIVYEQPVYFVQGEPVTTFYIDHPFDLVVATLPYTTPTHVTVGDVHHLQEVQPEATAIVFQQIGAIVQQARQALEHGMVSALGPLMNENHDLLRQLTVSDEMLDRLCQVACKAGALGAKLSGGGRGGNLIALVDAHSRQNVATALRQSGACEVYITTVSA